MYVSAFVELEKLQELLVLYYLRDWGIEDLADRFNTTERYIKHYIQRFKDNSRYKVKGVGSMADVKIELTYQEHIKESQKRGENLNYNPKHYRENIMDLNGRFLLGN